MSEAETFSETSECPSCGLDTVTYRDEQREFVCGDKGEHATLSVWVPVGRCSNCGFSFTDARAEKARHDAYCEHLGRLKPKDILSLRKNLGQSRAELAEFSGIGEASLSRWERGLGIQNAALDLLLYLLSFRDNQSRTRLRRTDPMVREAGKVIKLRCLGKEQQAAREQERFELRPTGT